MSSRGLFAEFELQLKKSESGAWLWGEIDGFD